MRPFTYRGISIDNHYEIFGFYVIIDSKPAIIPYDELSSGSLTGSVIDYRFIFPETLSIYTGTNDVNSNPIFTNDIVEAFCIYCSYRQIGNYPPPNVEVEEWTVERSVSEVVFENGAFCINDMPIEENALFGCYGDEDEDDDSIGYRHFKENWDDNTDNIQDEYPYLTWNHFRKPHIIGHTYDSFLDKRLNES